MCGPWDASHKLNFFHGPSQRPPRTTPCHVLASAQFIALTPTALRTIITTAPRNKPIPSSYQNQLFPEKFPDWLYHSQANFPESAVPPKPFTTEPGERDPRSSDSESVDKAVRSPDSLDGIVWMPSIFHERVMCAFTVTSTVFWPNLLSVARETMEHYYSTLAEQAEHKTTIEA